MPRVTDSTPPEHHPLPPARNPSSHRFGRPHVPPSASSGKLGAVRLLGTPTKALRGRRWPRAAWRLARRVRDLFPLTTLGLALAAAATVALLLLAYERLDLVVLVVGYGALALLALGLLVVPPIALLQSVRLRRAGEASTLYEASGGRSSPRWIEAGRRVPTGVNLPAISWFPLVHTRIQWLSPPAAHVECEPRGGRLYERVVFQERGRFDHIERRLVVEDAFGLVRIGLWRATPGTLRVLPALGALQRVPLLRSLSGGEEWPHPMGLEAGDRLELRRYAPGDPARFIHWRAFARTRKLVVRVPERALSRAHRTVAYLVAGEADEASAAAARAVLQSGALGTEWTFGADGGSPTDRLADALDMICESADHRGRGAADFEAFLREAERKGPASLVLFCPARPGPWLGRLSEVLTRRALPTHVVVGVDGLDESRSRLPAWKRWLLRSPPRPTVDRTALDDVVLKLQHARAVVLVVDRPTGRLVQHGGHRVPNHFGTRDLRREAAA